MNAPAPGLTCFHCGLPIPADCDLQVIIAGAPRTMCCPGCQAVAQTIVDIGMENYYEHRTATEPGTAQAPELVPAFLSELQDWDDPELQQPFVHSPDSTHREITLMVNGITCSACVWLVEQHLNRQDGIAQCQVNLSSHRARVVWNPGSTSLSRIIRAIAQVGYKAEPYHPVQQEAAIKRENRQSLLRMGLAGLGAMQVMMYAAGLYYGAWEGIDPDYVVLLRWTSGIVCTPVFFYSCIPFYQNAWRALKSRHLNMDVPVSLALVIAYVASWWSVIFHGPEVYFDSVSMFAFLLLLGRYLEMRVRHRSQRTSIRLSHHSIQTARRLDEGDHPVLLPAEKLRQGDRVLVRAGEVIPGDGRILDGTSSINEAMLTGEHLPTQKGPGDEVTGGTLNVEQPLTLEILRNPQDSTLSTLRRLLDRAESEKPSTLLVADRLSSHFVAALLLISVAVFAFWWFHQPERAFWIMLAVLVVSCPCALALATPTAITAATAALANSGFLSTRAHTIEGLRYITDVVFDKTGTLTEGRFSLLETRLLNDAREAQVTALAAALERASEHPIARAFHHLETRETITDIRVVANEGVSGHWNNVEVRIGKPGFAGALLQQVPIQPEGSGQWVLLATSEQPLAWFRVEDRLREDAVTLVRQLQQAGKQCHILSGDGSGHAREIGRQLGIDAVRDNASPQAKLDYLKQLQAGGSKVLMVGDGLNDAPVLAGADVSIAMSDGTDLAKVAADGVLLGQSLSPLLQVLTTVQLTYRIIKQNLAWAIGYNLVALPLAAAGLIPPWLSALGMSASSLIVVVNALRINSRSH
ncbi:MAG TPA: heavy metal translocating P-type ATPase [Dongiaceae bacterium]|nr:heavy metal translocating P-type ATPase [Dongiaceae bacterium]